MNSPLAAMDTDPAEFLPPAGLKFLELDVPVLRQLGQAGRSLRLLDRLQEAVDTCSRAGMLNGFTRFGGGQPQTLPLFGDEHGYHVMRLARLDLPVRVTVRDEQEGDADWDARPKTTADEYPLAERRYVSAWAGLFGLPTRRRPTRIGEDLLSDRLRATDFETLPSTDPATVRAVLDARLHTETGLSYDQVFAEGVPFDTLADWDEPRLLSGTDLPDEFFRNTTPSTWVHVPLQNETVLSRIGRSFVLHTGGTVLGRFQDADTLDLATRLRPDASPLD